ncbi:hypothetical protein PSCLAVI8L_130712 [Pseudoclavibacter sp. 8L]|nr:hypothetical protein PSCLAVI8L_130712 [Pseudoclavibacter sp. 8L]
MAPVRAAQRHSRPEQPAQTATKCLQQARKGRALAGPEATVAKTPHEGTKGRQIRELCAHRPGRRLQFALPRERSQHKSRGANLVRLKRKLRCTDKHSSFLAEDGEDSCC